MSESETNGPRTYLFGSVWNGHEASYLQLLEVVNTVKDSIAIRGWADPALTELAVNYIQNVVMMYMKEQKSRATPDTHSEP